jgi:hypothetical protein
MTHVLPVLIVVYCATYSSVCTVSTLTAHQCIVPPGCEAPIWLMAIAASYLQTQGVQQGVWFDLDTMTPLMASPAFKAAATMLADLAALMPNFEDKTTCMTHNSGFLAGRCAMTISWSYYFKVSTSHTKPTTGEQMHGGA